MILSICHVLFQNVRMNFGLSIEVLFYFPGLEKSLKDLNRQTISLGRLKNVLKEKSEQDVKDIKEMFKKFSEL